MASDLEMRVWRLEKLVQRLGLDLAKLADEVARLRQQRFAEQGGGGGGDSGASGVFLCVPAGVIAAGSTSPEAVFQSWDGASAGTHDVRNRYVNSDTVAGRTQTMCKNPDGSYTIIGQDCS